MNEGVRVPVMETDAGDAGVTHSRGNQEAFCRAARQVAAFGASDPNAFHAFIDRKPPFAPL